MFSGDVRSSLNHFKLPDSFDIVFDLKSAKSMPDLSPVCIWAPKCPPNYVPVGFLAKKDCTKPDIGDAYCVLSSLTEKIVEWETIWDMKLSDSAGYIKLRVRKIILILRFFHSF